MSIGYPLQGLLGSGPIVSQGIISAAHGINDDSSQMQISAPVQAGNSGGPVFDAAGNLVGIVVAKLDALLVAQHTGDVPQNVNFAIKASAVRQFLDTHQVSYRTALEGRASDVPTLVNAALSRVMMVACR